jgi:HD-GYP domain-containing protein (c-di-GMP phosphodiesterase class II)
LEPRALRHIAIAPRLAGLTAGLLGVPLACLLAILLVDSLDPVHMASTFHFWAVSATALAAAIACVVIMLLTKSLSETRLVFLGLGFLSIAAIFSVHGLATPGHIHKDFHTELALSSWLSVTAGSFFIALSVAFLPPPIERFLKSWGPYLVGLTALWMGLYIGLSIATPDWLSFVPYEDNAVQKGVTVLNLGLLLFSAWRYFQAYLFARLPSQWAMVCAMLLLVEVQLSLTFGTLWHLSWWFYHAAYALAFAVIFAGWAHESWRAGNVRVIAEALSMRDAIAQLNRGHSQPVAELVDAIEWKDLYTHGHVRRVATCALMIGKELGLSTLELRALALGAQMHDVGKIGIPDRILTKPARLTPEEYAIIREHVETGFDIASRVSSLSMVTDAIRYHHERWDGAGYPEGLRGAQIPLRARIVAVADAFDAMTSGRVYQPAVSADEAKEELLRCAGTHFDPQCVEAFLRALDRLPEETTLPRPSSAPAAVPALELAS